MKNMQKVLALVLCGALCVVMISCATGGGSGEFGPGVLAVGEWNVYNDRTSDGGSSISYLNIIEEVIDGQTKSVKHVTGEVTEQFRYGFAGWGLDADEATTELYKTARALSFTILGDGKRYSLKFKISSVTDYCYHEYAFQTEEGVVETFEIPMRFLMQPSWGNPARLNQSLVTGVEWQTHESWRPGTFDIKMWDFKIHQ
ncbi:MAG: CIA30 family protein [Treponema sp.]|nr:CIA30 family protein [Treponema sp.]